ncbi:hypothetical protein RJ55_04288 [Drechmeria coniospora]|nr:hypothetical protein RJ55_04288 [Drechmeria coniospora]
MHPANGNDVAPGIRSFPGAMEAPRSQVRSFTFRLATPPRQQRTTPAPPLTIASLVLSSCCIVRCSLGPAAESGELEPRRLPTLSRPWPRRLNIRDSLVAPRGPPFSSRVACSPSSRVACSPSSRRLRTTHDDAAAIMRSPSVPTLLRLLPMLASAAAEPEPEPHVLAHRSLVDGTWAAQTRRDLDGLSAFGDFSTCGGCHSILSAIKAIVETGNETFFDLAKKLCAAGTQYDADYCGGIIEIEGPVIASIIKSMDIPSKTADQFCITFLGVCKNPEVEKWSVPFPSPRYCDVVREPPSGKAPLQVIHYSDIHIDPAYEEGSSTTCKKPNCCQRGTKAEAAGTSASPAGPNGDHNCDVPVTLERSMYKAIGDMFPDAAFALFTGDIIDHGMHNTSMSFNEGQIEDAYGKMNEHIKVVYGTAGNHEAHPSNIFEPNGLGNGSHWVYDTLTDEWARWIGNDTEASHDARALGAYSTKYPKGNLRVISLNTNMYYRFNFVLYQTQMERDPNGQIEWLVRELDAAERAGENVYIIGHMPMGERDALGDGANYFDQVVRRYSTTIKAMFFGHTHVDHFEVSYSDYAKRSSDNAVAMSYICPSLTPTSGMPSFRVYDVDPETFAVLDATTYTADMSDPSFQAKGGPTWKKYYSAKEAYGGAVKPPMTDAKAELTPAFWHNVTEALEADDGLFDAYMSRKTRGWKDEAKCRDKCKALEICQMRAGRSEDNCYVAEPGVHFSKRSDDVEHGHRDECGSSTARTIFGELAKRNDMLAMLQDAYVGSGARVRKYKRADEPTQSATTTTTTTDECVPRTKASSPPGSAASTKASSTGGAVAVGSIGVLGMLALGALAV